MGTISAKKIQDALAQAQNLGLVEEPCTINGCALVLRSLRPDEYAAALADCKDIDNQVEYLNEFQRAHITRSIVEVNGVDLREADFIEVEEEVKNPQGQIETKVVKLERAAYLKKYVIKTWGRESVYTAYRKFNDAEKRADEEAKKSVQFYTPEETVEDKARRLIVELKEIEDEIPEQLLNQLLDEYGLMRKSTAEEIKTAMAKLDQEARAKEEAEKAEKAAAATGGQPQAPAQQAAPSTQARPGVDLSQRQPLNRRPVQLPPDPHVVAQQTVQQMREQVQGVQGGRAPQPAVADPSVLKKAQEIAALEAEAGNLDVPPPSEASQTPTHLPGPGGKEIPVVNLNSGVAELSTKGQDRIDPKALRLDQPPTGGINPKYRPQQR